MTEVRYRPAPPEGAWRVAVTGGALAALAPTVTDLVAEAVWRRVGAGGVGAIIEALTGAFGTSLSAIPDFALAVVEQDGLRVVVRGAVEVVVESGEGVSAVSGAGVATWVERFVADARSATIALADASGASDDRAELPIASGVVPASAVALTLRAGADGAPATADVASSVPAVAPGAAAVAATLDVAATIDATAAHDIVTAAAADAEPTADVPDLDVPGADIASLDTLLPLATIEPRPETEREPEPRPEGAPADVDESDPVWGATIAKPTAARRSGADADAPAPASVPPAVPPLPTAASAPAGDHDGETIAVADLRALRQSERERYESTDGVPPRRPARGRIRLSTGRVVELERPVVIGRRPKSTRTSGSELPTLVAVDSPEQDISRSHIEIRTESEHVLVTDLDTTNGTVLLRGGQEPVRLHPGEPTMVISGDVLDIGDGVTIAFEDLP